MKHFPTRCMSGFLLALTLIISSCDREDPGPRQDDERDYSLTDFDRLEMGDAFRVTVSESSIYSIHAYGDTRNLRDLEVRKNGSTLVIRYDESGDRRYDTHIIITMPRLRSVNFSGASVSVVKGFESDGEFDILLSGASKAQLDAGYASVTAILSGASELDMTGSADALDAELSGASTLRAFDFPVRTAVLDFAGASYGQVRVSESLVATAAGSSSILYRGNPTVTKETSGNSSVERD